MLLKCFSLIPVLLILKEIHFINELLASEKLLNHFNIEWDTTECSAGQTASHLQARRWERREPR